MDAQITKCAKCKDQCGTLFDALESIIHYDGHYEWLKEMRDDMEKVQGEGNYFRQFEEWHTEEHTIWMLLVGMFGEWGTSIRSGWIEKEKIKECIEFIDSVCELAMEARELNEELEGDDG